MLSRVAESLYWMARYIERAEAVARLAAVDFQALLDGTRRGRLEDVVRITSDAALFRSVFPSGEEAGVLEFLHAHPANPSGVLVCLSRARENARGMREQISSEMWEHLNRLYLLARDGRAAAMEEGPYAFFRQVRDGTQAFEGITAATMTPRWSDMPIAVMTESSENTMSRSMTWVITAANDAATRPELWPDSPSSRS